MFKFMKSKKGFTLVELMIVVVIMAILVAVAVPIYSAVTKNARVKTCAANRREIVSQVNGYLMGNLDGKQHTSAGSFVITSDGDSGTIAAATANATLKTTAATAAEIKIYTDLFQEIPYCPSGDANDGTYTVNIIPAAASTDNETTAKVTVECNTHDAEGNETTHD